MFRFTPRTIPSHILVVGCGGTGSRLIPLLTQFIASITKDKSARGWLDTPTIFIADDDVVEAKNLQRQNFVAADVGKHKAAVLAQRYGRAYGVNVLPILKRIDGTATCFLDLAVTPDLAHSLVIMCVDTAQARRDIIRSVNTMSNPSAPGQGAFIIDAGNEDNFGQVRFFNQATSAIGNSFNSANLPKLSPVVIDIPAIPIDAAYYDGLEDMPGQGSCADLDQTLAINAMMGAEIMGIVQNYYYVKPMTYNQISVSLDGARSTSYNTAAEFSRRAISNRNSLKRLHLSRFPMLDMTVPLNSFIVKTEKIMKDMAPPPPPTAAPTTVSEVAVEAAPKKRSRKKVSDEVAEMEPPVVLPLPPDTRTIGEQIHMAAEAALRMQAAPPSVEDDFPF